MKLEKLAKLREYRVFRDFAWPSDLDPFAKFNLIYGWNGSGKTTLSGLLRSLQAATALTEGQVDFRLRAIWNIIANVRKNCAISLVLSVFAVRRYRPRSSPKSGDLRRDPLPSAPATVSLACCDTAISLKHFSLCVLSIIISLAFL